jgi:hypothetical protein
MIWLCRMENCQIIQELDLHKFRTRWIPRALSEDHKARRMLSSASFLQQYANRGYDFFEALSLETRHGFTINPWRKTCNHGVENYRDPAIEKIQGGKFGNLLVNCVLGPQGCTGSGFHGQLHKNQCSVILCNPKTVTNSH